MKVIDLLNKLANGEINEDRKYQFSYKDYCTIREFFDGYIVDNENLNIEIIEENNKIEKLDSWTVGVGKVDERNIEEYIHKLFRQQFEIFNKLNEIIDKINGGKNE